MAAASRLTAAAARHIVDSVINNKGVIEANSVGTRNGKIVLGGATADRPGLPKQTIKISGKITATGKDKGQKGGTIQITGEDIQFAAAMLDVSGHCRRRQDPGRRRLRRRQADPRRRQQCERGARRPRDPDRDDRHGRRRDHLQRLGDRAAATAAR